VLHIGLNKGDENPRYDILARQLHEAIGLQLDQVQKQFCLTDLGATVYRCGIDGKDEKKIYDEVASCSGIGLELSSFGIR
jgi:hypothetical protein